MIDQRQKTRVLIVDDNLDMLEVLSESLDFHGYETFIAHNGNEAIEKSSLLLPDIILLDLYMPNGNGFEVLQKLRLQPITSNIAIIVMTGETSNMVQALKLGADDFIVKPFHFAEIEARINTRIKFRLMQQQEKQISSQHSSIFISYTRGDWEQFVEPLVMQLKSEGLPIWIDQDLIEGSHDWLDEINASLKACTRMILCVSPAALQSRYVKLEYRYAFNNGRKLYPLICQPVELPAELQVLHHYPYTQLNDLIRVLKRS